MKDTLDKTPVFESSTRHPELDSRGAVFPTGKTEFKRFRRRGNRDKVRQAKVSAPISTRKHKPPLDLIDPVSENNSATTQADEIQRWQALRPVTISERQTFSGHTPLVSFNRNDLASRAFDQLRTHLLQTLRFNGWRRIAIAAPTSGCGCTFTAVNLGLSFARVPGSRNLLMDLNLRAPGIAAAFGVNGIGDMRGYLSGEIDPSQYLVRAKDSLALGLANNRDQDAAELLLHQRTSTVLNRMNDSFRPDVTIYDLPPILAFDDLTAFLPQVDGVLLVSDGTKTTAAQIKACERALEGRTNFLGVVLNQARTWDTQSYVG